MMKRIIQLLSMLLFRSVVLPGTIGNACDPVYQHFNESEPYETITPVSTQLVYAKEYLNSGHVGMVESNYGSIYTNMTSLQNLITLSSDWYYVDSKLEGLPSVKEQLEVYNEAFFEQYTLLLWMSEGYFYQDSGEPTAPPTLKNIYLQDGILFFDDEHPPHTGPKQEGDTLEYLTFITVNKDDVANVEKINFLYEIRILDEINNPNTGDTSLRSLALPLIAVSLASASVTWCAKKQKRI